MTSKMNNMAFTFVADTVVSKKNDKKKKKCSASLSNRSIRNRNSSSSNSIRLLALAILATAALSLQPTTSSSRTQLTTNPIRPVFLLVDNEEKQEIIDEDNIQSWEYYYNDGNNENNITAHMLSTTMVTVYPNGGGGNGEEVTIEALISSGRTNFYDGKGRKVDLTQPIQLITTAAKTENNNNNDNNDTTCEAKNNTSPNGIIILRNGKTKLYKAPTTPGLHFYWPLVDIGTKIPLKEPASPIPGKQIILEMLSHSPRIFMVHNFISDDEIVKLQDYSQSSKNPYRMRRSTAGTHKSWNNGASQDIISTRTSTNAFDISTPTSNNIKKRSFQLLRIPKFVSAMSDGIQVLRYQTKQAYVAHHDYFPVGQSQDHNWDPSKGGSNRMATVFLYMSDVEEGGHTCFPRADMSRTNPKNNQKNTTKPLDEILKEAGIEPGSWEYKLTQDCYRKFSVQPQKGSALLFYSQLPDGTLDPKSIHGAGPVLSGPDKWGANVWVWNAPRYSLCSKDKAQGGLFPTNDIDFEY